MSSKMILFFDGRCTGNGTPNARAGYGYVIEDADGEELATGCELIPLGQGVATSNAAEYAGLIAGLRAVLDLDALEAAAALEVRGDSQLVIRQITGAWSVGASHIVALHAEAEALARAIATRGPAVSFRWIPRERNARADALSKAAFSALERGDPVAIPLPEQGGAT